MSTHPCMTCGACCSFFRVSFHWSETLPESFHVPQDLTLNIAPHASAMKGTFDKRPRCIALKGQVGQGVSCSIYENRPSCCRRFRASFEDGTRNKRCDKARLGKGLRPLSPDDWETPYQPEQTATL